VQPTRAPEAHIDRYICRMPVRDSPLPVAAKLLNSVADERLPVMRMRIDVTTVEPSPRPLAVGSVNLDHLHQFRPGRARHDESGEVDWLFLADAAPIARRGSRLASQPRPRVTGADLLEPIPGRICGGPRTDWVIRGTSERPRSVGGGLGRTLSAGPIPRDSGHPREKRSTTRSAQRRWPRKSVRLM
jgi:hypothetical protein